MNRRELFAKARAECELLLKQYPADPPLVSVVIQLDYLLSLDRGERKDAERLHDIIIPVLTTRQIAPLSETAAELLYQVTEQIEVMKREHRV